ncbi:MAG TPA: hypothetical protein VF599_21165 [Pyrinomonadaceae bacterium]|jgi:hypothetical protein
MADKDSPSGGRDNLTNILKSWLINILTLIFALLYAATLIGWLKPLTGNITISHFELIIFAIIGYYLGRIPALQNEKNLKDEINRQALKADAAHNAKEFARLEKEILEEKLKNAVTVLRSGSTETSNSIKIKNGSDTNNTAAKNASNQQSIETAIKILDS